MTFFTGVDLGQTYDFTAFAVIEEKRSEGDVRTLEVRHLERHRNRTYPALVARLVELERMLPPTRYGNYLAVDSTGVGRPVVDMIRDSPIEATVRSITITGGDTASHDVNDWRVPKRDLVSTVAVGLQTGVLRIARSLPEAPILERELRAFRAKISLAGNDTYEAWRERDHDDLVLAVALALWVADRARGSLEFFRRMADAQRQVPGRIVTREQILRRG